MSGDPSLTIWPWALIGVALLAAGIWLANWYLDQPLTETDQGYSATDIDLGRREGREPTIVGSELDTSDYDEAIDEWCEELFDGLVRWLELRDREGTA